jgi:hypothetical protein
MKKPAKKLNQKISQIDPFVNRVLQAHFFIEELIDSILKALAKNPDHLELHRYPAFSQKVKWIRAFGPSGNAKEWELISALTSVRNKVAHKFKDPNLDRALKDLRIAFEKFMKSNDPIYVYPKHTNEQLIVFSTKRALGFLKSLLVEIGGLP